MRCKSKRCLARRRAGFYIGREVAADSPEAALPLHGPNVWPPAALLPGWRDTMERYSAACRALGMRLTRLLALALGLEPGFFDAPGRFDAPQFFLRLLRYSAEASAPTAGVFGAGAHTDYGMLTLLATDDCPGLQIQPRVGGVDGPWRDVAPRKGAFIVNLGDMLERWTNGVFLSTRHRVVNVAGRQRLSMPFFFGARIVSEAAMLRSSDRSAAPCSRRRAELRLRRGMPSAVLLRRETCSIRARQGGGIPAQPLR